MAGEAIQAEAASTGGSLISDAKLKQLYATMLQCRLLSERARRMRNHKAMFDGSTGQEAIATGCAIDLDPQDTVALVSHDAGVSLLIAKLVNRVPLNTLVAELYTDGAPIEQGAGNSSSGSTAETQLQFATETATANKRGKNTGVVVVFTSEAATAFAWWRAALTRAAARGLPMIFVVEKNRALPAAANTEKEKDSSPKSKTLPTITVDGNDVVAVYRVAHESLASVRRGDGPVLVEGATYRLSTLDNQQDPRGAKNTVQDPLAHMEQYLTTRKIFRPRWKQGLVQQFSQELDTAFQLAQKTQRSLRP